MQTTPDTEVFEVVCTNRRFVRSRVHEPSFCSKSCARTATDPGLLGVLLVLGGQAAASFAPGLEVSRAEGRPLLEAASDTGATARVPGEPRGGN